MAKSGNYIFIDRSGNTWIGTAGYGILKYNARAGIFHRTGDESVRLLKENNAGKIMVVTKGDVAWLFDTKTGTFTESLPAPSPSTQENDSRGIDAIEQDDDGIYWLGEKKS